MSQLKLWLLDADIIIDLLSLDVFDKLVGLHKIYVASSVIDEVRYFYKGDIKKHIDFRRQYIDTSLVLEYSASPKEIKETLSQLPSLQQQVIHPGELESLAILIREEDLKFCSCDAAIIQALPFFDLSDRGVSAEQLLKKSGLTNPRLEDKHTERYFKENLKTGKERKILNFKSKK